MGASTEPALLVEQQTLARRALKPSLPPQNKKIESRETQMMSFIATTAKLVARVTIDDAQSRAEVMVLSDCYADCSRQCIEHCVGQFGEPIPEDFRPPTDDTPLPENMPPTENTPPVVPEQTIVPQNATTNSTTPL